MTSQQITKMDVGLVCVSSYVSLGLPLLSVHNKKRLILVFFSLKRYQGDMRMKG